MTAAWYAGGGAAIDGVPLESEGDVGYVLAKIDAAGALVWSRSFGDSSQGGYLPLAIDAHNDIVMGVSFHGSVDLGDGAGAEAPGPAILIAKLDPAGFPLWARSFPNDGLGATVVEIAVDQDGNVIFTGTIFPGSTLDFGAFQAAGDSFVAKLDPDGQPLWVRSFTGGQLETHTLATTPSGEVVLAGSVTGTMDFGGGPLVSAGGFDVFVAKLDGAGEHLWSRRFGDADLQRASAVTVDASGDVILAGTFFNAIDLGGGPLQSPGEHSPFVAKLDAHGEHVWSRRVPGAGSSLVSLGARPGGGVILAGSAYGPHDLGCGEVAVDPQEIHAFVAALDDGGACIWERDMGAGAEQIVMEMGVGGAGRAAVAGSFVGTIDLGGSTVTSDGNDAFVTVIDPPCGP
ncbi:MAG: hypothetical protein QM820_24905 [Minicystis sp.]